MEKQTTEKKCTMKTVVIGLALAMGPALAGFFISQGITDFKNSGRSITVKGLYEEEVKADRAIWDLSFVASSEDFQQVQQKSAEDSKKVQAFLIEQGFKPEELSLGLTKVKDSKTRDYGGEKGDRYVIETSVRVTTKNVDLIIESLNKISTLIKEGIIIDGGESYRANPAYFYEKFEDRRSEMYTKAIESAKKMAYKFTGDTGTKLGRIINASQGNFEINGLNQTDEHDHKKSPFKRIRLVTTMTFAIE